MASTDNLAIMAYYDKVIVPILLKYLEPESPLLDLGCGGGVLLTLLQRRGFKNLYGIDAASILLDRIPDKNIPVICDNYLNVRSHFQQGQFQAATVFNTLHHLETLEEFEAFFYNLHYIMKPGGLVFIKELRNGMFYRIYNGMIKSSVTQFLFPWFIGPRNFVQTHEEEMHSRFFDFFLPQLKKILRTKDRFSFVKRHTPLSFENLLVVRANPTP